MAYCNETDLLLGDITLPTGSAASFVTRAADEMDAEIGEAYEIPLPTSGLPAHVVLRLKQCNVLIASGRLVLAQAIGGEENDTHAYGMSLLREGQGILKMICSGQIELVGATRRNVSVTGTGPSIIQGDAASAVDAFYGYAGTKNATKPHPIGRDFWTPGL